MSRRICEKNLGDDTTITDLKVEPDDYVLKANEIEDSLAIVTRLRDAISYLYKDDAGTIRLIRDDESPRVEAITTINTKPDPDGVAMAWLDVFDGATFTNRLDRFLTRINFYVPFTMFTLLFHAGRSKAVVFRLSQDIKQKIAGPQEVLTQMEYDRLKLLAGNKNMGDWIA